MTHYTPWLINLAYARQHRRLQSTETEDDALISSFIAECSAEFIEALGRLPMPYIDTKSFDSTHRYGGELRLREDLLAVTTLTNGDSTVIGSSDYNLRPDNHYPKSRVEITDASGYYWYFAYGEDRVQVAGTWGYVPHYPNMWKSITTLAEEVDTSETAIDLTSATNVSVGDYLKVDNEVLGHVTAISTNTVTVDTRGYLGTTAAAHSNLAAVSIYQQLPDIKAAVREMVTYRYKVKDQTGGRVQVYDGGVIQTQDIDPSVEKTIKRHKRKLMPMAV